MPKAEQRVTGVVTVPHGVDADLSEIAVRGFHLSIVEGPASSETWTSTGGNASLGSHPLCDLQIDDPTVSRFHCEIRIDGDGARVRDTGSRNGTIVDGVRVVEAFLRGGSLLRLGRTVVRMDFGIESNRVRLSEHTSFGQLLGQSVAMRGMFALLERAAVSDTTVLLEGETGTGKTLTAHSIHQESPRRDGPFVYVDCGAIPTNLLESELFGHEKGSFTGAETRRIGAFEEASGGTLLLDEIGELGPELQPKLLGALENRKVRRVGSNQLIPVDVRLVAATNRDLRAEINEGRFRSDLFFRLAVIRIVQPPLRERPEDVPLIAHEILRTLGADEQRIRAMLTPAMNARLQRAAWPGNVRELKNYLERCLVFDDVLPLAQQSASDRALAVASELPYQDARQRILADFESAYLKALLRRHDSRVADAAAAAGIDRTYFYRLLRRHGLNK